MERISNNKPARRRGRGQTQPTPQNLNAFALYDGKSARPVAGFLDEAALAEMKARAFELLEKHGIAVVHPAAIKALKNAGAKPGNNADSLRLPRALVEEALRETPKQVTLYGKKPDFDISLPRADHSFIMRTGTGAHGYIDPETAKYRNLDLDAVKEMAAVASGLDQVGFIAHPFVHGVPEITSDIHSFAQMIRHTEKHVWIQPYAKDNVEYLMRLAVIAAGGEEELRRRPLASCITCSFSPLEFKHMDTEAIIQAGRHGLPLHACSLPTAGGTAPLSTVGAVLVAAAEILAIVTLTHLLSPGTPVIATPLMFTLDMRTGSALQSCSESLQSASMAVQLMKQGFGLPTHTYGAGSDTPDVDGQSMAERALLAQTIAQSGADILGGVGQLECATVFSPVQAVLDNEIGTMLRRLYQVPEINDENLNWAELSSIRVGGHFLDSKHTVKNCRDQLLPKAFLRQGRDDYEATDKRTAFDQARDMALDLIRNAPPEGVLGEDANTEITRLVADADRIILESAAANSGAAAII